MPATQEIGKRYLHNNQPHVVVRVAPVHNSETTVVDHIYYLAPEGPFKHLDYNHLIVIRNIRDMRPA